jgi:Right handed beta helix region/Protein of unknown function (DUF1565)
VIGESDPRRALATLRRAAQRDRRGVVVWAVLAIAAVAGVIVAVGLLWRSSTGEPGSSSTDALQPVDGPRAPSPSRPPPRGPKRYVSPTGDDAGPGSRARPWRTLQHAAAMVRPGLTVRVAPGHYRGPLTIRRGGTAKRPVRFVSTRRWGAKVSAGSRDSLAVVAISGDHVSFERFDVTGRGGDGSAAIHVEANHDAVIGNRVHDLAVPCLDTGNGGAGILVGGGRHGYRNHHGLVVGNLVERVGSGPRDGSCRLVHGIYASVPKVTIVNNIIHRSAGDGITSWHAARKLMVSNNVSAMNGGAGILIGSGDGGATRAGNRGTLVSNNIAYRNMLDGITESSDGEHPVGPGNRYLHNLAYANDDGESGSGVGDLSEGAIEARTLNADPRFAGRAMGSGREFSLLPDSPAVDAGTCAGAPRDTFDRAARPQGRGVDIGARELPSTAQRCDG